MLARTANNLYWLARYMERMSYLARLLEVGQRMSGLGIGSSQSEWHSTLVAAGVEQGYLDKHGEVAKRHVIDYLVREPDNPSSIVSCIAAARMNGRAVRNALTADTWDALNGTHLEAWRLKREEVDAAGLAHALDWVKMRSALFNGAYSNTMLRRDNFYFARLGTFVERADNTARLLDVKYHVLLPRYAEVGGVLDYYQWTAILRSASALRAYHWLYRERIQAGHVAELLILRPELPRSIRSCYDMIAQHLDLLADEYGGRSGEPHRLAGELHARLKYGRIEDVMQHGLHEFLAEYVDSTVGLGDEIARFYLM